MSLAGAAAGSALGGMLKDLIDEIRSSGERSEKQLAQLAQLLEEQPTLQRTSWFKLIELAGTDKVELNIAKLTGNAPINYIRIITASSSVSLYFAEPSQSNDANGLANNDGAITLNADDELRNVLISSLAVQGAAGDKILLGTWGQN